MKFYIRRQMEVTAIKYNGKNLKELKDYFQDVGNINPYIDGMLTVDTPHGRLTLRIGEYLVRDENCNHSVYTAKNFDTGFEEIE